MGGWGWEWNSLAAMVPYPMGPSGGPGDHMPGQSQNTWAQGVCRFSSKQWGRARMFAGRSPATVERIAMPVTAALSRANGPCKRMVSAPRSAAHVARGIGAEGVHRRCRSIIQRRHNSNKQDFKMLYTCFQRRKRKTEILPCYLKAFAKKVTG